MVIREYYSISDLAVRWSEIYDTTVTAEDVVHLGIKKEIPIYINLFSVRFLLPEDQFGGVDNSPDSEYSFWISGRAGEFPAGDYVYLSDTSLRTLDLHKVYSGVISADKLEVDSNAHNGEEYGGREFLSCRKDSETDYLPVSLDCLFVAGDCVKRYELKKAGDCVDISNDILESLPLLIKVAADVYENCWADLPEDMDRPKKENIEAYIKTNHKVTAPGEIEAIRCVSRPPDTPKGGRPKKDLMDWRRKQDR